MTPSRELVEAAKLCVRSETDARLYHSAWRVLDGVEWREAATNALTRMLAFEIARAELKEEA